MSGEFNMTMIQTVVVSTNVVVAGTQPVISVPTAGSTSVGSNDNKLTTGWILAIVFMVLFSIALTVIVVMYRKLRRPGAVCPRANIYDRELQNGGEEYVMERPPVSRVRNDNYRVSRPRTWFRN